MTKEEYVKEHFYSEMERLLNQEDGEITSEEIRTFLTERGEASEFISLCKKFAEVGINSLKKRVEGTCDIVASFQFRDIENARIATQDFCQMNGISDIKGLLDVIKTMHSLSVPHDQTTGGVVYLENGFLDPESVGRLYDFTRLPDDVWENICKTILTEHTN